MIHIIGAGPAGISLAYYAVLAGYRDISIYEMTKNIGGMARSWLHENFILDTGPHIFHTSDIEIENDWLEIGRDLLVKGQFNSCNILAEHEDKLFHYPISFETLQENLTIRDFCKIKGEIDFAKNNDNSGATSSFKDFMQAKFGKTLTSMFFEKYPKKVWGLDTKNMLADWAPQRIELREKNKPFYTKPFVAVGKKGTGCFYERIIQFLKKESNFKLFLEHRLTGIQKNKNHIKNLIFNNTKIINLDNSDHIFSTIPASNLSELFGLKINLNYRGVKTEYFFFENKRVLPKNYNWVYCSDEKVAFNRITEPSTMTKNVSPKGYTFVCVETTFPGGKIKDLNDDSDFLSWIKNRKNFDSSGLIPELYTKNVENYVYPIQDNNFRSALTKYNSLVSGYKNLNVLGTGGEFHYSDMQIIFRKSKNMINSLLNRRCNEFSSIPLIKNINLNRNDDLDKNLTFKVQNNNDEISNLEKISNVKVPLIAEIGINHNGNLELAKNMMFECKRVGAHFAKFQYYKTESRVERNSTTEYLHETADGVEISLNQIFERSQLNLQECKELIRYGKEISLPVFFTAFDIDSAYELNQIKQKIIKVASMDCNNIELHNALNKLDFETIIISTGMSNLNEVLRTLSIYKNKQILLMSCRSSYPVNLNDIDLGEIKFLKEKTGLNVGFSDHTEGILASLLAVASGATFIERHFTINKSLPGPDNKMSLNAKEMNELSKNLQITFNSVNRKRKIIHACEQNTFQMQKKSLRFPKNFKKNEIIHTSDLVFIAPPEGYCQFQSELRVGKLKLLKDVNKGSSVNQTNVKQLDT